MDPTFVLFHLALADEGIVAERHAARGGDGQHVSFVRHAATRSDGIGDAALAAALPFEAARDIALAEFQVEEDGTPALCARPARHGDATERGLPVRVPDRFHGLV
jgi:hypothetical protein